MPREAVRWADGRLDPDETADLRVRLADVLLDSGDHHAAAEQYHRVADDLLALPEPDLERVFQRRLQEAACHDHTEDLDLALHVLRDLLADELTRWPADDPRLLVLRRQIGELEARAGHTGQAQRTLSTLRDDLVRLFGSDHAATTRVVELLGGVES
ncbi:hypothetical protein GCM10009677_53610 [Sphaerisporangium rubeum]|uniref:Tetratricopeptide repeat protein n=1 Tax=Sphaerisporangium rubeum TaxID=321317 RepID=A0A7X0M9Y7_9ACTN|nr:hypothetical protein [Sphaerisporangium rubeum]MBB6475534.1 hypothetical protein [Sphaerisporangium rubeum]